MYEKIIVKRILKPILAFFACSRLAILLIEEHSSFYGFIKLFFSTMFFGAINDLALAIIASTILLFFLLLFDGKITKLASYRHFFYKMVLFCWFFILSINAGLEISFWFHFGDRYNSYISFYKPYLQYKDVLSLNLFIIISSSFIISVILTKKSDISNLRKAPLFFTRVKYLICFMLASIFVIFSIARMEVSDKKYAQIKNNGILNLLNQSLRDSVTSSYPDHYISIDEKIAHDSFFKQIHANNEEFVSDSADEISRWSQESQYVQKLSNKNFVLITHDSLPFEALNEKMLNDRIPNFTKDAIIFADHFLTSNDPNLAFLSTYFSKIIPANSNSLERIVKNSLIPIFQENSYKISYFTDKYMENLQEELDKMEVNSISRKEILQNIGLNHDVASIEAQLSKFWIKKADELHEKKEKFFFTINSSRMSEFSQDGSHVNNVNLRVVEEMIALFAKIKEKDWFKDTIFIFTSNSVPKKSSTDLLNSFHAPLVIYRPGSNWDIKINKVTSSKDLIPTILSLMNVSYLNNSVASSSFFRVKNSAPIIYGPVLGMIEKKENDYVLRTIEPRQRGSEAIHNSEFRKVKNSSISETKELVSFFQFYYNKIF